MSVVRSFYLFLVIVLFFSLDLQAQVNDFPITNFDRADSIAKQYNGLTMYNLKVLSDKLTNPLDQKVDQFRALYRWVCENISYDHAAFIKNEVKHKKLKGRPQALDTWQKRFSKETFKKLLTDRKTVCTGYAYLLRELAYHAGIECVIVDGYSRNARVNIGGEGRVNHSWNAVKLHGQWYLCDPTWSSGIVGGRNNVFKHSFEDSYFLTPPETFIRNHYPLISKWSLMNDPPSLDVFLHAPLIYTASFRQNAFPVFPDVFKVKTTKGTMKSFVFDREDGEEEALVQLKIEWGNEAKKVVQTVKRNEDGNFAFSRKFYRKGDYVLHVLIENEYVFSYHVNVTK